MSISFPRTEEEILSFWRDIKAFETQLHLTEDGPSFNFYDGPPFGTFASKPHVGYPLTIL